MPATTKSKTGEEIAWDPSVDESRVRKDGRKREGNLTTAFQPRRCQHYRLLTTKRATGEAEHATIRPSGSVFREKTTPIQV